MTSIDYEAELKALFPAAEVRRSEPRYFWIEVPADQLRDSVLRLREKLGLTHLSTIVGEDMRDHFLLTYAFAGQVVVALQVKIDRDRPEVLSLAPVVPGAIVYERELHDLFGIVPLEHPDLRRQVLPEDWPAGVYPLRKDVILSKPAAETAGEEKEEKTDLKGATEKNG